MKKLLLSVIAFALITTSCNKYKDDFKNLNARLDALSAQVAGVSGLATGIAALQAQLTSLSAAIAAIPNNTAAIATLTANLATLTTTVGTINTNLNTLAANVAAGNVTTQGLINALTTQTAANQAATLALVNSVQAALTAAINSQTTALIANLTTQLAAATAANAAAIAAAQAAITANANTNTATITALITAQHAATIAAIQVQITAMQGALSTAIASGNAALSAQITADINAQTVLLTAAITAAQNAINANTNSLNLLLTAQVNALQTALNTANANILILLNNQNIYEGDLIINNEATLVFAEGLLDRVNIVKGSVLIDETTLSATQKARLALVTAKMKAVLQPLVGPNTFDYRGTGGAGFANLASISAGNVYINATGATAGAVDFSGLKIVTGNYIVAGGAGGIQADITVRGVDINDAALQTVSGNYSTHYSGSYNSTSLTTVGGDIRLVNVTTPTANRTTTISFPNLTSALNIYSVATGGTANPLWSNIGTTSIDLGAGQMLSLTGDNATSIRLGQARFSAPLSVSGSLTAAGTFNLTALDSTNGALAVTGFTGSTVDLSNYRNGAGGTLTANSFATLNLPKYSYGTLFGTSVKTLTAPVYRLSSTKAGAATDLNGLTTIENITIGALEYIIQNAEVVEANIKTIALTANGVSAEVGIFGWPELTTASFAGNFSMTSGGVITWTNNPNGGGVGLDGNPKLTSVTTSGVINNFVLYNNDAVGLTSVSLSHTHKVGGPGSYLWVTLNDNLAGLNSSSDFAKSIRIESNTKLTNINLASYVSRILGGPITVNIFGNKTSGTYTATVVGTATTARVDCKYTSTSPHMSQMKTYLLGFDWTGDTYDPNVETTAATVGTMRIDIDDVDPTPTTQSLDLAMTADAGISIVNIFNPGYPANVATSAVSTILELNKFQ